MDLIPYFLNGLIIGSIYGLITIGLSFIFGILKIINVAHGSFVMLGAYIAYFFFVLWAYPPLVSIFAGLFFGALMGLAMYYVVIRPLQKMGEMHVLVALFALGSLMAEVARIVWGPNVVGFTWNIGSVTISGYVIPLSRLAGSVVALAIAVLLQLLLYRTSFGRAVRAVVQDPIGAQMVGVDVEKIFAVSTAIGIALTTAGGVLLTLFIPVGINPYMGDPYTLMAFVIAVMGGLGSTLGAYVAGLIFGEIYSLGYPLFSALGFSGPYQMSLFAGFVVLILFLLFRPTGLFRS
ncbi:MAG: branched-chain amino acid ABC transporter permease [Thermoproteus sp.]